MPFIIPRSITCSHELFFLFVVYFSSNKDSNCDLINYYYRRTGKSFSAVKQNILSKDSYIITINQYHSSLLITWSNILLSRLKLRM